jgi:hypothetical protein
LEIEDLKQHGAPLLESDTISIGEGEESTVVHDGVHVLNPDGIYISIINYPVLGQ